MALGNEEAIIAALEQLGSDVGETKRGWVHASCPLASRRHSKGVDLHPSFGVSYNSAESHKSEGHAHCFSCGYSGDIREIASLLYAWKELDLSDFQTVMELMEEVKTGALPLSLTSHTLDDPFPDAAWMASFPEVSAQHTAAIEYLESRGIDREVWKHFDVRFDPQRYRVAFPLYDRAQRCRGLIGRTLIVNPDGPRYFYYPYPGIGGDSPRGFTWFNENALDLSKPIVVVEGIFDALKVWPVYENVTAALSVSFRTPGMEWHLSAKRYVSMFDEGQGGMLARGRLNEMAPKGSKIWHLSPPPGRSDPGEATPEEILKQIESVKGTQPITIP